MGLITLKKALICGRKIFLFKIYYMSYYSKIEKNTDPMPNHL